MTDWPQSNSRTSDGRFVKGHPGGPGRPRKIAMRTADPCDEPAAPAADSFELMIELVKQRDVMTVKLRLASDQREQSLRK